MSAAGKGIAAEHGRLGRGLAVASLLIGLFVLGSTILFVVAGHVAGPSADFWRAMEWLESAERGTLVVGDLLRPYGGHRLFFPALLFLLEYESFGGTNVFLLTCCIATPLLILLVLGCFLWRDRHAIAPRIAVFVTGLALALFFSGTQIRNLVTPWNIIHLAAPAALVLALAALIQIRELSAEGRTAATSGWTVLAILAATLSNYSLASGLLAWPVLLAIGFGLRLPAACLWAIGAAGLVAGGTFFVGHDSGLPLGTAALIESSLSFSAARFAALLLGMPLSAQFQLAGAALGVAGLSAATALLLHFVLFRRSVISTEALLYGMLAFAVAAVLMSSAGRHLYFGGQQWQGSRLQTNVVLFWFSLLSLGVIRVRGSSKLQIRARVLLQSTTLLWLLAVLLPAHLAMSKQEIARSQRVADANLAIAVGMEDPRAYSASLPLLNPDDLRFVERYLPLLRDQGWGMFAAYETALLGTRIGDRLHSASTVSCDGAVDAVEHFHIDGTRRGLRLEGWAWTRPDRSPPKWLVVTDRQQRIVGLGHRASRETWRPWRSEATQDTSRWVAFAHPPQRGAKLLVWMELADGAVCRVASTEGA